MKFFFSYPVLLILVMACYGAKGQNGKILSKKLVNLTETRMRSRISQNGELTAGYAYLKQLSLYAITYQSDSFTVNGFLLEPSAPGKYPVVIFNRGGNRDFGALTEEVMISYTSKLAAQGYVIIASNYRSADEFGGRELNDVLCLMETMKEIPGADTSRVGMFGWSRGGLMTYLALKKDRRIKTAVIGNGPTDLFGLIADRPEMETEVMARCIPDYFSGKEEALRERSAIYWPEQLCKKSSLLILCGTKDRHVNPAQADKIAAKLEAIQYDFKLKKFDTDHFFTGKKAELSRELISWFDEELKHKD